MAKQRNIFPTERWMILSQMLFTDDALASVVTKSEAANLWDKAESTIEMQIAKGRLKARTSLSGGAVLITVASLTALWGKPVSNALAWAQDKQHDMFDDFAGK